MSNRLKPIRIYIENSVIGGYFDIEFLEPTRRLFELFNRGIFLPVISTHVEAELAKGAPDQVKNLLKLLNYEKIELSDEVRYLVEKYMEQEIVSENFRDDTIHVAVATVSGVDILVSWNFRHIVNFQKIRKFNAVNMSEGYQILDIRSPKEVIEYV